MPAISSKTIRNTAISLVLILLTIPFYAAVRKEYNELDQLYNSGKLDDLADALTTLKPINNDERACLSYYSARLKIKNSESSKAHEYLVAQYPQSAYAQLSLLELSKISILEREISKAKGYLRKINATELLERFYWLELCAFWEDDYSEAINHAENYLRLAPKGEYAQAASYLMAECYIEQKKFYSAVTTLNQLKALKLGDLDEQYLFYRLGYAYEQSDKLNEALSNYRQGYELDKYTQIAHLIEDRLFELRSRNSCLDIGFLYPYPLLQIAIAQSDSCGESEKPNTPTPDSNSSSSASQLPDSESPVPLKLKSKPISGLWLQAGRFSQEANANKLVVNIRLLELPAVYYEDISGKKKTWVVLSGAYPDKAKADDARIILSNKEINSFVTQY